MRTFGREVVRWLHAYLVMRINLEDSPFFVRNLDLLADRNIGKW
jgi:hypothetical protein